MSKYFNSTLRTRKVAAYDDLLKPAIEGDEPAAVFETPTVVENADSKAARENGFQQLRTVRLPLEKLPHAQFRDSNSHQPAEESYRALRTRLLRLQSAQEIQTVVITSALQGDGKTLTSLNLALCCSQIQGMKVLLIDADVRNCGLSRATDAPQESGLADVLSDNCEPEKALLQTDRTGLYLIGSGISSVPAAELFASKRWQGFIAWSKKNFDLILVDSPPALDLSDVELITAACDGILMVVRAMCTGRETLQKCVKQIDSKKLLGVVYNGVQEAARHRYYYGGYTDNRKA